MSGRSVDIQQAFREAGISGLPSGAFEQMTGYLELLTKWNARLNLTAIRSPADMISRHLVECGLLAQGLPQDVKNLMDYGSGAGLPGVVVAFCRPEIQVTLAEAHGKKASFLREVTRSLSLKCEIYEGRVEAMPSERKFDAVSMRAVESMELAIPTAWDHVARYLVLLTTETLAAGYRRQFSDIEWTENVGIPNSEQRVIAWGVSRGTSNHCVPRGTA